MGKPITLAGPIDAGLDRIARRIAGREAAREIVEYVGVSINDTHFMGAVIEELNRVAFPAPETPAEVKPEPIARLGATVLPFGQHNGKTFDETPLDYLDWLCRSQEGFYRELRAYLKHPELASRRRGSDRTQWEPEDDA